MKGNRTVTGVFEYLDDALNAVREAAASGIDYKVYSPVPNHELEELTMPGKSPVRFMTSIGAVLGVVGGFALTVFCSLDMPLRASAKPIISPPPFAVIAYECTILFGALFTLVALFHFCKLPWVLRSAGYDPRFSQDRFGVVLGCNHPETEKAKDLLLKNGAEEVFVKEGF